MKTCPICNSVAFDDATICFGCVHPFTPEESTEEHCGEQGDAEASGGLLRLAKHASNERPEGHGEDESQAIEDALSPEEEAPGEQPNAQKTAAFLLTITLLNDLAERGGWACEISPLHCAAAQ